MRTRILGVDEWGRIEEAGAPPITPLVNPDNAARVVVEGDGDILAAISVLRVTHLEDLWIHPGHRDNLGVTRALLRQAVAFPQIRGESWVLGSINSDRMRRFVARLNGVRIPGEYYAFGIGRA